MTRVSKPVRSSISRRELVADAAEDDVAELVGRPRLARDELPLARRVGELVALADDDDREVLAAVVPLLEQRAGGLDGDRLLGDQDHVGAAGDPGVERDPAGVAAHHLDDHDAVVRLRGRVQPVDRLGRDGDGRVEAERVVGAVEVVVDRLRDADHREAVLRVQAGGDAERVLAADRDERVQPFALEVLEHVLDAAVDLERVRARGAEDRAAARQDPGDVAALERLDDPLDEPAPALAHGGDLPAAVERPPGDGADDGVQPGAVAAAREDPDAPRHAPESRPG